MANNFNNVIYRFSGVVYFIFLTWVSEFKSYPKICF